MGARLDGISLRAASCEVQLDTVCVLGIAHCLQERGLVLLYRKTADAHHEERAGRIRFSGDTDDFVRNDAVGDEMKA
jgi:hypothetical protein